MPSRGVGFYGPIDPSGSNSNLNGVDPPLFTPGRMRITIDPVGGNDANPFVLGLDADPAGAGRGSLPTYLATLQTLQGAINRLPHVWRHPIFIDLPSGIIAGETGLFSGGPEWVISGFTIDGEFRFLTGGALYDAGPGLYLNGEEIVTLGNQTADIFSSTTIGRAALAMTVDAHRGAVVEIVSGQGAGQWRRIGRNTATTLLVIDAWTTNPNGTSVFRIFRPDTTLEGCLVVENIGFGTGSGVSISPEIIITDAGLGSFQFLQTAAATFFAGSVDGGGVGVRSANVAAGSVFSPQWFDYWRDPNGLKTIGPYLADGEWLFYGTATLIQARVIGTVADRFKAILNDYAAGSWKIDASGDDAGARSAAGFLDVTGSSLNLFKGSYNGSTIQRYAYGAFVSAGGFLDASGCDFADHTAAGAEFTSQSKGNLRSTTSAAANGTVGAIVRGGSNVLVNRTATTVTGATANVRLGNPVSGANLAWTAVPAGDALNDAVEASVLRDQAS